MDVARACRVGTPESGPGAERLADGGAGRGQGAAGRLRWRLLQSPAALLPELLFPLWPSWPVLRPLLGRPGCSLPSCPLSRPLPVYLDSGLWACVWLMSVPLGSSLGRAGVISWGDASGQGVLVLTRPRTHRAQGPSESLRVLL